MENSGAVLCIFGATGDLATKKILPALQQWYGEECPFDRIWCLGRRPLDKSAYHAFVESKGDFELSEQLKAIVGYHRLDFDDADAYHSLEERLRDEGFGPKGTRLFFLAVKPDAFVTIAANLQAAALFTTGDPQHRLLFEKPFGESRESAVAIQTRLMDLASEEQVYRIDHYLGKEMIRNILTIRFANRIFSESWHGGAIETVAVTSIETAGVAERLEYYDRAGAINDMVQSHLLQMVALVAMAAPENLEPESIRRNKIDVLKNIEVDPRQLPVIGQYEGYAEQIPGSTTETYVEAQLRIDTPQWQGTRFIVTTGKKLGEKRTEIRLYFRPNNLCVSCAETIEAAPNQLVIEVFPQEGVQLQFNSKVPGYDYEIEQVTADYCHSCRMIGNKPEAYVKLIKDTLEGDKTLFAGFDELLAQWRIADQIQAKALEGELIVYPPGSGPVSSKGGNA
jgi:glucose-6-phosphate 1-dehydrogenase